MCTKEYYEGHSFIFEFFVISLFALPQFTLWLKCQFQDIEIYPVFPIFVIPTLKQLRPYFFAALVITYFLTVVGMPVYMHYCGGEVEEVSYLINDNGCCGDEVPAGNDCCHDEGLVLSNKVDFTIKDYSAQFNQTVTDLFYLLPDQLEPLNHRIYRANIKKTGDAPPFQNSKLAEIVVLRI